MNKGRRVVSSFVITAVIWLIIVVILVILSISFKNEIDAYYKQPFCDGLCPSIGLGIKFPAKDMDLMIERYSIYLQENTGTPQFYERVKDLILENYTLVGDTYYYNKYLASGIQVYESINLILPVIIAASLFVIAMLSFVICLYRCNEENKIRMSKPFALIMIILSYISCNVYAVYRFMKGYKEIVE